MELLLIPALLAWNALFAWAWRRATSCGVGGGVGVPGSVAVSDLPFALFPLFLLFFSGGSCDGVEEDGVGAEIWEIGTYDSSMSSISSSLVATSGWVIGGASVPTPQSRTTNS